MPSSELLQHSLDEAFRLHMQKLFEVLLVEGTYEAFERFVTGMDRTCKMYDKVKEEYVDI